MMMYFMVGIILVLTFMMFSASNYQNFQILGISLAPEHADTDEVKALQRKFKIELLFVGLLFSGLSLTLSGDFLRGWRDFAQFILLFTYIISSYIPFILIERRLINLKHEKGWIYATQKRLVDISVTREKGKAAPSKAWVWLIWLLMWIPLIIGLVANGGWGIVLPMLIIPIIMLILPLSYPMVIRTKTPFVSKSSEITQSYMRRYERINALAYLLMALLVSLFFISFTLLMLFYPSNAWAALLLIVFLVMTVGLFIYTMNKNKDLQAEYVDNGPWKLSESKARYVWGAYYDPEDSRLFVPKRVSGMGITLNVARPAAKVIMGLIAVLVIGGVLFMSTASFEMIIEPKSIQIEAPMYGVELAFDEIESIELSQKSLDGRRTNGYGGMEKSFGFFNLDHYGPVKLYTYSENPYHIDILLKNDHNPQWIIFNQQTPEETETIYSELVNQWEASH